MRTDIPEFGAALLMVSVLCAPAIAQKGAVPAVRVGFVAPMTGTRASIGQDAREAAVLAVEDIAELKSPCCSTLCGEIWPGGESVLLKRVRCRDSGIESFLRMPFC